MLFILKPPPSYKQLLERMWIFYGEINCKAGYPWHGKQIQAKLSEIQMVKGQVPAHSSHRLGPMLPAFHCLLLGEGNQVGMFWGEGFSDLLNTRTAVSFASEPDQPKSPKGELDSPSYIDIYTQSL